MLITEVQTMIPERYLSDKAKAKRKQRKLDAEEAHQFHLSMDAINPPKPRVNTSLRWRGK